MSRIKASELQTQALVRLLLPVVVDDPFVSGISWLRGNQITMAIRGEDFLGKVSYSSRDNIFHVSLAQVGHSRTRINMDIPASTSNPAVADARAAFQALFAS